MKQEKGPVRFTAQTVQTIPPAEELEVERSKKEGERAVGKTIDLSETSLREAIERTIYVYWWQRGLSDAQNPIVYRFGMLYSKENKD